MAPAPADSLGQPLFPGIRLTGYAAEVGPPPAPRPRRTIDMPAEIITELTPVDYAAVARKIMRGRDPAVGEVLSVVRMLPADGQPMIDTRTVNGPCRPRLAHPPSHVVLPPEIFTVRWRGTTLRFAWIHSHEKARYPVGGILFLPMPSSVMFHLVTFNVGRLNDSNCTNVHHAEMLAVLWINQQPTAWQARLGGIGIWNFSRDDPGIGYSPCNACCVSLAQFLTALRPVAHGLPLGATITWRTLYKGNQGCGHPTDAANLQKLKDSGWRLRGPGPAAPGTNGPGLAPSRGFRTISVRRVP